MADLKTRYPGPSLAWACVAVLIVAYALSFIDRLILSLLVEPIKRDLHLSDFEVSLLQGFAFALFYTVAGIPIGRLVDSGRRTTIIAVGIACWSFMTAACGMVQQYWQLFLTRAGVGIGEATLAPAAYSLLGDLFPPERRGLALGIFSTGTSIGAGLALIIGGHAIDAIAAAGPRTLLLAGTLEPWQLTFIYVGLPGLLVAGLLKMIPEPARRFESGRQAADTAGSIPLRQIIAHYKRHARTIGLHHLAMGLSAMAAYGIMSWAPAMLMRGYNWAPGEVGTLIGGCILVAGTTGVVAGGWLGDHLVHRGRPAGRLDAATLSMGLGAMGAVAYPFQESQWLIAACFMLAMLGGFMVIGCGAAALLEIMPNRMRGQATAIYFFGNSLLGIGAGPVVVAYLTDYVFRDPSAVRYSLAIAPPLMFALAGACFRAARRPYSESLAATSAQP